MYEAVEHIQGQKTIQAMQWGLVPSWTKESETKPDFFRWLYTPDKHIACQRMRSLSTNDLYST